MCIKSGALLAPTALPAFPCQSLRRSKANSKFSRSESSVIEPAEGHLKLTEDSPAYQRPSKSSKKVAEVHAGKFVNVTGTSREYAQVKLKTGETAYVPMTAIQLVTPTDKSFQLTSDAEVLAMLREARLRGPLAGVMHSFTGTAETAAECVALGMYVSFAGMVTFKKSDALRAVAATIPADHILIETDSPYLAPHPLRGKRNEPANVAHTAVCIAAARGVDAETFAEQTTENARRLFRMDR